MSQPPSTPLSFRIALVEDNPRMGTLVQRGLGAAGIAVDVFPGVAAAWEALRRGEHALAIVDRGLGDGDGLALVRRLRADGHVLPCLMLTARDALHDRVDGLEAGADDYLPKPFAMEELAARVRALLRRPAVLQAVQLAHGDLWLDPASATLGCGDRQVGLPPAELQIAVYLMRAQGALVRRSALEAAAWGTLEAVTPNALDVALHRLRRRIESLDAGVSLVNVRSQGFALRSRHAAG